MYSMKQACQKTDLSYETLKLYCNQRLVPNVKRDHNNRRVFDDRDIAWIQIINCLSMKGEASIPEHKRILSAKKDDLTEQMQRIRESIDYIDHKQSFYDRCSLRQNPLYQQPDRY